MYLSFYDLRRKPFEITVDPDFLWLGEKHKEALATLEYGIREDKGFLLLTGDVGTGKTVLINRLVRNIHLQSIISTVPDPGLDLIDFYNFLAATFKFGRTIKSKGEFLALLKKFLIKAEAIKRKVLLLIDEAQRLNHNLLEEIRLLSNIEMENRKLISIFFVGQSEFNQILLEPRNRAVRQRIAVRYQIEPLSVEETAQYVLHRLRVAGAEHSIFSPEALREIFVFTSGNPRLTNIICDHALLTGYSMERETIDSGVIRECAEELQLPGERTLLPVGSKTKRVVAVPHEKPPGKHSSISPFIVTVLIIAAILTAGYFMFTGEKISTMPWSPDQLAPQGPPVPVPPKPGAAMTGNQAVGEDKTLEGRTVPDTGTDGSIEINEINPVAQKSAPGADETLFNLSNINKVVIRFNHNSNELPTNAYTPLDRFAASLLQNPNISVIVNGYTDDTGVLSYNVSVSEFRANIVKSYLVGKGVDPSRIAANGVGPKDPIGSNATAEGRSLNRRVEIIFTKKSPG
ncbi:MAG: AAA family ATPase [Desulfobacterales bacterium]|nr:AAA family ATPase [Desulfobacterales bacterium]